MQITTTTLFPAPTSSDSNKVILGSERANQMLYSDVFFVSNGHKLAELLKGEVWLS